MKCFTNVFRADLKRFWNIAWKMYIAFAVYCFMQAFIFFSNMDKFINKGKIAAVSLGDSLMDFFKGAKEFYPERKLAMDIPVLEIFVLLFLLFIVAYYINSDRSALSKSIMIASRSPVYWWVSKYIITVLSELVYMILIIITFAVSGFIVLGNKFSLEMHFTSKENIRLMLGSEDITIQTNVVLLLMLCTLCLITACIITLLVSYLSNSIFGFIINLLLFIFSICYMKWFGFYNYMMMYRIPHVYGKWYLGALLMVGIDAAVMAVGIIYSRKRDFL